MPNHDATEQQLPRRRTGDYGQLTAWNPGESGNPAGRPKMPLTSLLKQRIDADNGRLKAQLVDELIRMAMKGTVREKVPAILEIFNRIDGKVPTSLDVRSLSVVTTPERLEEARIRLEEAYSRSIQLLSEPYKMLETSEDLT